MRIKDLVRQLLPMTPLNRDLGTAGLAVLEHVADPRALLVAWGRGGDAPAWPFNLNFPLRPELWRQNGSERFGCTWPAESVSAVLAGPRHARASDRGGSWDGASGSG